ncbi:Ctr copper transporter family-domain-containing protein [Cladochytrium replicatum]|nr:Ctr copper transporter family-domain-containing protein [Cladochytrium replicatum]
MPFLFSFLSVLSASAAVLASGASEHGSSIILVAPSALVGSLNETTLTIPCIARPWESGCSGFTYTPSDVDADVAQLCSAMSVMPGCTINDMCKNNTAIQSADYCKPFSVLGDLCKYDMPRMTGCRAYTSMCGPSNSTVTACTQVAPLANLPTTDIANQAVRSICSSMSMDGCEKCTFKSATAYASGCDLLSVYSQLCLAMPDMTECSSFNKFCSSNPSLPICSGTSTEGSAPAMLMYFHMKAAYVLFNSWVPRSPGDYTWTFIVLVLMGIALEGIIAFRPLVERYCNGSRKPAPLLSKPKKGASNNSNNTQTQSTLPDWLVVTLASMAVWFIRLVETSISYLLMLAAMSFNVVVFVGVVVGLATGHVAFLRFKHANRSSNVDGVEMNDESNTLCC